MSLSVVWQSERDDSCLTNMDTDARELYLSVSVVRNPSFQILPFSDIKDVPAKAVEPRRPRLLSHPPCQNMPLAGL